MKTTTFKKEVLLPGVFNASTFTGERTVAAFPEDRISRIKDTAKKMLDAGLKIPAPFAHKDDQKVVPEPIAEGVDPTWNSAINGGYWTDFEIEEGKLIGTLEVPGDREDPQSIAHRVGTTIQQMSPAVQDWTDGDGTEWKDAIWHVALVDGHAIQNDQKNFEPVESDSPAAAVMSIMLADKIDSDLASSNEMQMEAAKQKTSIEDCNTALSLLEKFGISLPGSTTYDNFVERLVVALTALDGDDDEEGGDLTKPPKNTEVKSQSVQMSDEKKIDESVLLRVQSKADALAGVIGNGKKAEIKGRIEKLVEGGKVSKKYADEHLLPKVDGVQLSLDDIGEDGGIATLPIEDTLSALESIEGSFKPADEEGQTEGDILKNEDETNEVTDELIEQVYNDTGFIS